MSLSGTHCSLRGARVPWGECETEEWTTDENNNSEGRRTTHERAKPDHGNVGLEDYISLIPHPRQLLGPHLTHHLRNWIQRKRE
jgi:hypothetical protein